MMERCFSGILEQGILSVLK